MTASNPNFGWRDQPTYLLSRRVRGCLVFYPVNFPTVEAAGNMARSLSGITNAFLDHAVIANDRGFLRQLWPDEAARAGSETGNGFAELSSETLDIGLDYSFKRERRIPALTKEQVDAKVAKRLLRRGRKAQATS